MQLVAILQKSVAVLRLAAQFTESTIDDKLVDFLDVALKQPQIVEWLEAVLNDETARAETLAPTAQAHVEATSGLSWVFVITTVLPLLKELVAQFKKPTGSF